MAEVYTTNNDMGILFWRTDETEVRKDQNGYLYANGYYDTEDKTSTAMSTQISIPAKNINSNIKLSVYITRDGKLRLRAAFFNREGTAPTDIEVRDQDVQLVMRQLNVGFNI